MNAPLTGTDSVLARAFDEPDGIDETEEITAAILVGARDVFCRVGVRRATMADVARAAGFSRITVYRRFATKDVLVDAVVRWEFRRYFAQFLTDIKDARTPADRVVAGFVSSLRSMRGSSLIGGLLAAEPAAVVPSMVGERGRTFATVREFVTGQLRAEQKAGTLSADLDVVLVGEMMVRVAASFLVTPEGCVDLDDPEQVARIAREFLVPMLTPPGA